MSVTSAPKMRGVIAKPGPGVLALAAGALALGLLFHAEAVAAVTVWMESTAFGHCFFVAPIAAFLAWERRGALRSCLAAGVLPRPQPWAALLMAPLALAWFAAERVGIMEGRQLAVVAMLQVLALGVLGWPIWRVMCVPLLYLFFLVPFGGFLTSALQGFTARFIDVGLGLLQIPHVVDDYVIEIPQGVFRVAEACAGLRFLIASIALGVVYAFTIYRSSGRRAAFIAASIAVPIVANGLRALGIVVLGAMLGNAEAGAVDHVLYGWLFFSLVTMALILGGLPFREDRSVIGPPALRASASRTRVRPLATGVVLGLLLLAAAAGPAASALLDRASAAAAAGRVVTPALVLPAGCRAEGAAVRCDDVLISVRAMAFDPRVNPRSFLAAQRALAGRGEQVESSWISPGQGPAWRLIATTEPVRLYALGMWATPDGAPADGLRWRVRQALAGLRPAPVGLPGPVLAVATVDDLPEVGMAQAQAALRAFLQSQRNLAAEVAGSR